MRKLLWVVPLAAFFLNPGLACTDEPEFQYGAAEMRAAVEGDWSFTITPDGGGATQVTVHIEQAATAPGAAAARAPGGALVRTAHTYNTRTLVKGAGACSDSSQMPLAVSYISGNATFATATLSGMFWVHGLAFAWGDLQLTIGPYQVAARVGSDRSVAESRLVPPGAAGTLTVSRL